jgi:hypothetical protein
VGVQQVVEPLKSCTWRPVLVYAAAAAPVWCVWCQVHHGDP